MKKSKEAKTDNEEWMGAAATFSPSTGRQVAGRKESGICVWNQASGDSGEESDSRRKEALASDLGGAFRALS